MSRLHMVHGYPETGNNKRKLSSCSQNIFARTIDKDDDDDSIRLIDCAGADFRASIVTSATTSQLRGAHGSSDVEETDL
jgi:hypothetical protein